MAALLAPMAAVPARRPRGDAMAFLAPAPCARGPRRSYGRLRSARMCAASRAATDTDSDAGAAADEPAWALKLSSPSKINLFLRVLSRRPDGYHELASLFQAVSLRDELSFARLPPDASADVLECDAAGVPTDSSNLVLRALRAFRDATGTGAPLRVRLDKRVPAQAGLGGGSGNAATALWGANELAGRPASTEQLAEIGAGIGSDVSFFFSMGTAYCTGRGEILTPVDRLMPQTLWIIKPSEGLSTPEVFRALDLENTSTDDPEDLLRRLQTDMLETSNAFVNDLEAPSFALQPRLAVLKKELQEAGFSRVLMSGSGTSFFCLGQPHWELYGDNFAEKFRAQFDVQIFRAFFMWRKHPDYWYLQQPTEEELLDWQKRRDASSDKSSSVVSF